MVYETRRYRNFALSIRLFLFAPVLPVPARKGLFWREAKLLIWNGRNSPFWAA
jgi:hypothetical protein